MNILVKNKIPVSTYAVLVAMVFIITVRFSNVSRYETTWDVLGYYMYLPATFIHHDPMLNDITWLEKVNESGHLSGTLYQVSTTDSGDPMYFFLMGMALFFLPFFLVGHGSAWLTGAPMDGFSEPYQYALVAGGVFYTCLALWLLRKILRHYFQDKIVAIVILVLVFATNFSHHLTLKNLETVNILFLLMCWLIWSTIRWHKQQRIGLMLQIGCAVSLMALVKPTEILAIIIPAGWGIYSKDTLTAKIQLLKQHWKQVMITVILCFLVACPQLIYWYMKTGHFLYDPYKNPGIGLDLLHPHTWNVLFSYRKGWLVYTPVIILGLAGLFMLIRKQKPIAFTLILYFIVSFYILSSWTEWWYGASFSCRPVIISYPILAIGMGTFFTWLTSAWARISIAVFTVCCLFLNQFQWWQLRNWILDPDRTTKDYYWAIFLNTHVTDQQKTLKSVFRSFKTDQKWLDKDRYTVIKKIEIPDSHAWSSEEFRSSLKIAYGKLTKKDHLWIKITTEYETADTAFSYGPFLATSMLHGDKTYGYKTVPLTPMKTGSHKQVVTALYLTPGVRSPQDLFSTDLWDPGKNKLRVLSATIWFYARRE